jgi:hypothetical protein
VSAQPAGELHSGAAPSRALPASGAALDPLEPPVALALDPESDPEDPELEPAVNFELWLLEIPEAPPAWVEAEPALA